MQMQTKNESEFQLHQLLVKKEESGKWTPIKVNRVGVHGEPKENPINGFSLNNGSIGKYVADRIRRGDYIPDYPGELRIFSGGTVSYARKERISFGRAVLNGLPSVESGIVKVEEYDDRKRRFTKRLDFGLVVVFQPYKVDPEKYEDKKKYLYVKVFIPDNESEPLIVDSHTRLD